jgi:hypothetical protein
VRILREPVTVIVDDLATSHWETGKAQGRKKRESGYLDRMNVIVLRGSSQQKNIIGGMYG